MLLYMSWEFCYADREALWFNLWFLSLKINNAKVDQIRNLAFLKTFYHVNQKVISDDNVISRYDKLLTRGQRIHGMKLKNHPSSRNINKSL